MASGKGNLRQKNSRSRRMNEEEKIVKSFLEKQYYNSIEGFPLGKNNPPDFSIEGQIAIEVRRLNKQIKSKSIEDLKFSFVPKFKKMLKEELEQPSLPYSIAVLLSYKRPLSASKQLLKELKESITLSTQSEKFGVNIDFNNQISYSLHKGNGKSDQTYELCGEHDLDAGGNVQEARYESLKTCILEKNEKMKEIKNKYSELWLILVDTIFHRVDETTKLDLQRFPKIKSDFKRIIIISKCEPSQWIDLNSE